MPWEHCDLEVLDDEACPICGVAKKQWTLEWNLTREFQVARNAKRKEYVRILLLDAGGKPVADEPFTVDLPDADRIEGSLDEYGTAKVSSPSAGVCLVTFPRRRAPDVLAVDCQAKASGTTEEDPSRFVSRTDPRRQLRFQLIAGAQARVWRRAGEKVHQALELAQHGVDTAERVVDMLGGSPRAKAALAGVGRVLNVAEALTASERHVAKAIEEERNATTPQEHVSAVRVLGFAVRDHLLRVRTSAGAVGNKAESERLEAALGPGCERLAQIAAKGGAASEEASHHVLRAAGHWLRRGGLRLLEGAIRGASQNRGDAWPAALAVVGHLCRHEGDYLAAEERGALATLEESLLPVDVGERVRWALGRRASLLGPGQTLWSDLPLETIEELVTGCAEDPDILSGAVQTLCRESLAHAFGFGSRLATEPDCAGDAVDLALSTLRGLPCGQGDTGFLCGLIHAGTSLANTEIMARMEGDELLRRFVPALRLGPFPALTDLQSFVSAIASGGIPASSLRRFSSGLGIHHLGAPAVCELVEQISRDCPGGAPIALELLLSYAEATEAWPACATVGQTLLHMDGVLADLEHPDEFPWHLLEVLFRLLEKERPVDQLALALAGELVRLGEQDPPPQLLEALRRLVALLLELHPKDVWPVFGEALLAEEPSLRLTLVELLTGDPVAGAPSPIGSLTDKLLLDWAASRPDALGALVAIGCHLGAEA